MGILNRLLTFLAHFHFKYFRKYKLIKRDYEAIPSFATYSPRNKDIEFNSTYEIIKGTTLVDKYRLYEMWSLIRQSGKLSNGAYLEVGSYKGGFGLLIGRALKHLNIKGELILCDTFEGVAKATSKDDSFKGGGVKLFKGHSRLNKFLQPRNPSINSDYITIWIGGNNSESRSLDINSFFKIVNCQKIKK